MRGSVSEYSARYHSSCLGGGWDMCSSLLWAAQLAHATSFGSDPSRRRDADSKAAHAGAGGAGAGTLIERPLMQRRKENSC